MGKFPEEIVHVPKNMIAAGYDKLGRFFQGWLGVGFGKLLFFSL